jgi:hypothetical protein
LWINLWITGAKSVDKLVEDFVDSFGLWITPDLSTFLPQENSVYPQFCTQPRLEVLGVSKGDFSSCPHIHSPYYYY